MEIEVNDDALSFIRSNKRSLTNYLRNSGLDTSKPFTEFKVLTARCSMFRGEPLHRAVARRIIAWPTTIEVQGVA